MSESYVVTEGGGGNSVRKLCSNRGGEGLVPDSFLSQKQPCMTRLLFQPIASPPTQVTKGAISIWSTFEMVNDSLRHFLSDHRASGTFSTNRKKEESIYS